MKKIISLLILFLFFAVPTFASNNVTATVASSPPAAGTWTSAISAGYNNPANFLNISVYGATWVGTVYIQRRFQGGTWYDVTSFTTNTQKALIDRESGVTYRIGIKNGDYTSGSVAVRLSF